MVSQKTKRVRVSSQYITRMSRARILAFAQLLRIPNVFTAFADIALGVCVAVAFRTAFPPLAFWGQAAILFLASGSLYLSGMIWNDVFDRFVDAEERPFRPIPSGRVSVRTAALLASVLMALGVCLAGFSDLQSGALWNETAFAVSIILVINILLYDAWLKHYWIGPLVMAWCRTANVALGLTLVDSWPTTALDPVFPQLLPAVVGWYIVAVTVLARDEARTSSRWLLLLAMGFFWFSFVLAVINRAALPSGYGTAFFPYLLVGFGFWISIPIIDAYRKPGPREVQRAVKRCILGIVVYDAILATAFVGLPGLFILLLLPPALLLGKWVYST
jgi:4-hydroxybenzoate polyprenyltransferase